MLHAHLGNREQGPVAVPAFNSPYIEGIILHLSDSKAPQSKLVLSVLLVVCH